MTNKPETITRKDIRRDMIIDTLGNTALAFGLWGWWGHAEKSMLSEPLVFIALTATGILNLIHLPARLKRLKRYQESKREE